MESDKILFSGFYGRRNTGDDAFGIVSTWGAKHFWEKSNINLLSSVGPTCDKVPITYSLSEDSSDKVQLLRSFMSILCSNYSILAGGSILHSKPRLSSARRFMYILNNVNAVKMGAIGVSLGPYKTKEDRESICKYLKNFQFLSLRDRSSYEEACTMDLPYAPIYSADLAFMLTKIYDDELSKVTKNSKLLGITLCHSERYTSGDIQNEMRREQKLFETINELSNDKSIKFRFFIFNDNPEIGDKPYTKELIKKIFKDRTDNYEVVNYSRHTLATLLKLAECQTILTTRLHGAIFSAIAEVPALLVEYHKKCTDYLNDIGIDKDYYIGDMTISSSKVVDKIKYLMSADSLANFYPNRIELINRAEKSFTETPLYKGGFNL